MDTAAIKLIIGIKNIKWVLNSLFWKKDPSVVIFGSWFGKKFADNPRFLFEYLSENKDSLGLSHVVWITRSEEVLQTVRSLGYEAYLLDSPESVKYHKIAKYHIANNAPASNDKNRGSELYNQFSFRAHKVNLWHGVAVVKGITYDSKIYREKRKKHPFIYTINEFLKRNSSFYRKFFFYEGGWGDCYFVAPSVVEMDKMFRSHMLPEKRFIITGYARNCPCPKLTKEEEAVIDIIKKYQTSIIYMPTFRTGDNEFDFRTVGLEIKDFLEQNNILWIQKGHTADKHLDSYSFVGNILCLTNDFDTNVIVPLITILVSDYSTAMMDGLYHKKPVLLYTPDFDVFSQGERGLVPEAKDIMAGCGNLYYNIEELKIGLKSAIDNPESVKPVGYNKTRELYWGEEKSLEQIWKDILTRVGGRYKI